MAEKRLEHPRGAVRLAKRIGDMATVQD